jgi:hypothetical protein
MSPALAEWTWEMHDSLAVHRNWGILLSFVQEGGGLVVDAELKSTTLQRAP